ncbi:MAG TPA: hypothetical protein VIL34_22450 [Actinopolymorphaceae bacterium]
MAALGIIGARVIVVESAPDPVVEIRTGVAQQVRLDQEGLTIFWREGESGPPCTVMQGEREIDLTLATPEPAESADGTVWYPLYETKDPVPPGEYMVECLERPGRYAVGTYGSNSFPEVYISFVGGLFLALASAIAVFLLRRRKQPRPHS